MEPGGRIFGSAQGQGEEGLGNEREKEIQNMILIVRCGTAETANIWDDNINVKEERGIRGEGRRGGLKISHCRTITTQKKASRQNPGG